MGLEIVLSLVVSGLVIGALGRLAIPGPDPMPLWLMILLGIVGSFLGGSAGYAVGAEIGAILGAVVVASLLVVLCRRVVQKRTVTGPRSRLRAPGDR